MTALAEPCLLQVFFKYRDEKNDDLDNQSKAALRLCNKQMKAYIDATIIDCKVEFDVLDGILGCNWSLKQLIITDERYTPLAELPSSLVTPIGKFPLLEKLSVTLNPIRILHNTAALPANIVELTRLKVLTICGFNDFPALPSSFGELTSLERLKIAECSGLTLEGLAPIQHLTQLKYLEMGDNLPYDDEEEFYEVFPEWICTCHFPFLEDLSLGGISDSCDFPQSVGNFKHLTSLCLTAFDSQEVPESICNLSLLRKLQLYIDEFPVYLPDCCSMLTGLEELTIDAAYDGIDPVEHLTGLTKLNFQCYPRVNHEDDEFPEFLFNLTSLKALSLVSLSSDMNEIWLPDGLGNLKNLELLNLSDVVEVPRSIGNLSGLIELSIQSSFMEALPEAIGNLNDLEVLKINCAKLSQLPESIGNLKSLKNLVIDGSNILRDMPDGVGNLKNLELLDIGYVVNLPDSIGNLSRLNKLLIKFSNIKALPESIGNLKKLKVLGISYCRHLSQLCESVGNLNSLERLFVEGCGHFAALPDSIGNLATLKELKVRSCKSLKYIPDSFADLVLDKSDKERSFDRVEFRQCPELKFSQKMLQAIDVMKKHGVYDEERDPLLEI